MRLTRPPYSGPTSTHAEIYAQTHADVLKCLSLFFFKHTQPSPETIDRILATIYGQCIGDAIGLLTEFLSKDEAKMHYGKVAKELEYRHKQIVCDFHRSRWQEGDWTDDSDQMILIMRSLIDWGDDVTKNARDFAKTTHYDPRCQASTVAVSVAIATMLQGKHKDKKDNFKVKEIIQDAYEYASTYLKLDEADKIGYTYKSMGTGFWALKQDNVRKTITKIMMQGGDVDSNACVGGALLLCKLGLSALPESWLTKLLHKNWLDNEIKK
ncbi:unnamed protein product [Mytilus coruscus]|uniref:ADPRH n=1 Tax=Mytilus coruscus TaxID=42192 RepID=A0A6J8EY63_MYTCO|nr:unnamed protein product [Mytilus coruscus]